MNSIIANFALLLTSVVRERDWRVDVVLEGEIAGLVTLVVPDGWGNGCTSSLGGGGTFDVVVSGDDIEEWAGVIGADGDCVTEDGIVVIVVLVVVAVCWRVFVARGKRTDTPSDDVEESGDKNADSKDVVLRTEEAFELTGGVANENDVAL
jgi:hypothetical protein